MLGWLFGGKGAKSDPAADEAFDKEKQAALERSLGPMDDTVFHAVIPCFIGGGLDLYTFSQCMPGTVFVTQELIGRTRKNRPKAGCLGHYELAACLPPGPARDDQEGVALINRILNPMARFAFLARLSPGETAEVPLDGLRVQPVLFDRFDRRGVPFWVGSETFGLLLCMPILLPELAFAREKGTPQLLARLQQAGVYPYADLNRRPVV